MLSLNRPTPKQAFGLDRRILALLILALLPTPVWAAKYAAEFLKVGVGARALGMGGAFVATADDATAAYWNPAGLAGRGTAELLFMHAEQFGDLAKHDYFGYTQPLAGTAGSGIGIALIRLGIDDILETAGHFNDRNGNGTADPGEEPLPEEFTTGSDVEYALLLSYARLAGERLRVGGNVKVLRQGLLDNTSFGLGIDLGVLYRMSHSLAVGARLADATTTQISWDTGTRETVSPSLAVGTEWRRALPSLRGDLGLTGDLALSFDGEETASQFGSSSLAGDFRGGLEYWYADAVAARVGSDAGHLTAGAGLRYRGLGADYAYLAHPDLDATHRVSASVRF